MKDLFHTTGPVTSENTCMPDTRYIPDCNDVVRAAARKLASSVANILDSEELCRRQSVTAGDVISAVLAAGFS